MTKESLIIIIFSKGVIKRKFVTTNTVLFNQNLNNSYEWLFKNNGATMYCYDLYYKNKFCAKNKNGKILMSEGWFDIGEKYSYQSTFSLLELKTVAQG